jgi:hypothetical protein
LGLPATVRPRDQIPALEQHILAFYFANSSMVGIYLNEKQEYGSKWSGIPGSTQPATVCLESPAGSQRGDDPCRRLSFRTGFCGEESAALARHAETDSSHT